MTESNTAKFAEALYAFVAHARFTRALSLVIISTAFGSFLLRQLMGTAGLAAVIASELVLVAIMLLARRRMISWSSFIPISLGLYLAWCLISVAWSYYLRATFEGLLSQLSFAALALAVAATRDSIQIVRALGDVLRVFLSASLVVEIIAGVLIDSPIKFLSIQGNLITGGGIQGVFGSRNALTVISLIALIVFVVEYRTKSIPVKLSVFSLVIAIACVLFGQSPVGWATLFAVAIVAAILFALRTMNEQARRISQYVLSISVSLALIFSWVFRGSVLEWLASSPVMHYRQILWGELSRIASMKFLNGWGWVGTWPQRTQPFGVMRFGDGIAHNSGLNAYLDAWLQVGLVGAVLFVIMIGLAFVRSWILASSRKSELYLWAPLVLVALLVSGLAESFMLVEWGWLLVVILAARSSQELSWRNTTTKE